MSDIYVHLNNARDIQSDPFLFTEGNAHYVAQRAQEVAREAIFVIHHAITGNENDNIVAARNALLRASPLNPILLAVLEDEHEIKNSQSLGIGVLAARAGVLDVQYARQLFMIYGNATIGVARAINFRRHK